jgi:arsenate reductase
MGDRLKILFLCTGNSCRSQMAEGWARHLRSEDVDALSAGTETHGLDPYAVKVMAEAGVDISGARSKNVREFLGREFDYVITLCDNARETCPFFPGAGRIAHAGFDDPPSLAAQVDGEQEKLAIYRRVRDEIREFVEGLPGNLQT